MIKIKLKNPQMINEALAGLQLPEIINTKVMEDVTINAKAQEVYGRFIQDWAWNWAHRRFDEMTKYITMNHPRSKRLYRGIFFQFYANVGGVKDDLLARDQYHAFSNTEWNQRLGDINMTGMIENKVLSWKEDIVGALYPTDSGNWNDIDPEKLNKALDDFIEWRQFMQDMGVDLYAAVNGEGPMQDPQSKSANYSYLWKKVRKIMKSISKYIAKRNLPRIGEFLRHSLHMKYLNLFISTRRSRHVTKLREYLNEDGKNWVDIEKLLKDPGDGFGDSYDAVVDFVENVEYRKAYDTMCSDAGEGEIAPKGKPCVIKKYGEEGRNYFFWFSRGSQSCELFGSEGRNCGGGRFTLIDLQRKIHRGDQSKRSWYVGLDFDVDQRILYQILGQSNTFPREKYWPYIKDFIETYDVEHIKEDAFEHLRANSLYSGLAEEEIFDFIMAVGNGAVKAKWIERAKEKEEDPDPVFDDAGGLVESPESVSRWKRNLNYQPPKEIDAEKAHAVQSWYKKQKERLK